MARPQAPDPVDIPDEDDWSPPAGMSPLRKVALTLLMVVLGVVPGLMLLASDPLPESSGETANEGAGGPAAPVEGSQRPSDVTSPDDAGPSPAGSDVPVPEPSQTEEPGPTEIPQPAPAPYVPREPFFPIHVPSNPFFPIPDSADGSAEEGEPWVPAEGAGAGDDAGDDEDDVGEDEEDEDEDEDAGSVDDQPKRRRLISIRLGE